MLSIADWGGGSFVPSVTPSGEQPAERIRCWYKGGRDGETDRGEQSVCLLWEPQQSPNEYLNTVLIHHWHCHCYSLSRPSHLPLPVSPSFGCCQIQICLIFFLLPLSCSLSHGAPRCNQITATEMECIRNWRAVRCVFVCEHVLVPLKPSWSWWNKSRVAVLSM